MDKKTLNRRVAETMTVKKLDVFRALVLLFVLGLAAGLGLGYAVFH